VKFNGGICGSIRLAHQRTVDDPMQAQRKTAFRTIDASDFLLPEPERRRRIQPDAMRDAVVEDAIFEVIASQPNRPSRVNDNPAPHRKDKSLLILPLATRIAVGAVAVLERQLLKLSAPAFSTMLMTAFFAVFWLCGGFSALNSAKVVQAPSAPFAVDNISVASEDANGMKILSVTGTLTNTSSVAKITPALRVVSGDGKTTFGTIASPSLKIAAATSVRFSGRFKLAGGKLDDIAIIPETR
jgi:hypothetical protein